MFVYSVQNLMLENRMSYDCKNRLRNIGPAIAGSARPVPAPWVERVQHKTGNDEPKIINTFKKPSDIEWR